MELVAGGPVIPSSLSLSLSLSQHLKTLPGVFFFFSSPFFAWSHFDCPITQKIKIETLHITTLLFFFSLFFLNILEP